MQKTSHIIVISVVSIFLATACSSDEGAGSRGTAVVSSSAETADGENADPSMDGNGGSGESTDDDQTPDAGSATAENNGPNDELGEDAQEDDNDGDGAPNLTDNCVAIANEDQLDSDLDGLGDACDVCPEDADYEQTDSDGDGRGDACETATAGSEDEDGDGIANELDNCLWRSNEDQLDTDGDGRGDDCDSCPSIANTDGDPAACLNSDGDDPPDVVDNCPELMNAGQEDTDGDGVGDVCDICVIVANASQSSEACEDGDGDDAPDVADNCLGLANDQVDTDRDGLGDACDNCPMLRNPAQYDGDMNGIGDHCEYVDAGPPDEDGDGIPDGEDPCPLDNSGNNNDGDGDGVGDVCDNCPLHPNAAQQDGNDDGTGDACSSTLPEGTPLCDNSDLGGTRLKPNLMFLLDLSGSMDDSYCAEYTTEDYCPITCPFGCDGGFLQCGSYSQRDVCVRELRKWDEATAALDTISDQVVSDFNPGLALFPARNGCDDQSCLPDISLPVAETHTGADFRGAYAGLNPDGGTPLYRALAGCSATAPTCYQLPGDPYAGTRAEALVVITDGDPNTGGDIDDVVNQISTMRANDPDLQVYVIGFGGGATPDNLRRMAQAGGTGDYYLATDASSLVNVLQQISALLIGCEVGIIIDGDDDPSRMAVSIDNNGMAISVAPLPPGAAATDNGWAYNGSGVITLLGQACDDLKNYAANLPPGGSIGIDVQIACACDSSQDETCEDLLDNDCDGRVDEGCYVPPPELPPLEICDDNLDNNGDGNTDEGCCLAQVELCNGLDDDCDDSVDEGCGCIPTQEICNGLDDDCDSNNDEGCDGICEPFVEACNERDDDCDDVIDEDCCDAPQSEICDNVDNDCDGQVDEGCIELPL